MLTLSSTLLSTQANTYSYRAVRATLRRGRKVGKRKREEMRRRLEGVSTDAFRDILLRHAGRRG